MKRFFSIMLAASIGASALPAQKIEPVSATFDDYVSLLNAKGFEVFPFDISALANERQTITFSVRQYNYGKLNQENVMPWATTFPNMKLVSDSPGLEAELDEVEMYDREKGILALAKKLFVKFSNYNDSTKYAHMSLENMGECSWRLPLARQYDTDSVTSITSYNTRAFKLDENFVEGEFIPLVLLGSCWYDKDCKVFRFCGESELNPKLDENKIVAYIPHFYVVGITIEPYKKK